MSDVYSYSQRYGLAMWRYSVLRQPELLLTEVTKDDVIFCSLDLFVGWN
jgi:hypothetical protein